MTSLCFEFKEFISSVILRNVHWGINPSSKIPPPPLSFLQRYPLSLNLKSVQAPPFLRNSSLYIVFCELPLKIEFLSEPT